MNKIPYIITTSVLSLVLSACNTNGISLGVGIGGSIGKHVGIGTSVNIPVSTKQAEKVSKLNIQEQQIITYFDTQGNSSEKATSNGFYRQLITKQGNDAYWVQDFYQSGEKRSEPMLLTREQLFIFRAHPSNGSYTIYAINGSIMLQQNFRNGQLIVAPR